MRRASEGPSPRLCRYAHQLGLVAPLAHGGCDGLGATAADAGHLAQLARLRGDHVERVLSELLDQLLGDAFADARYQPRAQVARDALARGGQYGREARSPGSAGRAWGARCSGRAAAMSRPGSHCPGRRSRSARCHRAPCAGESPRRSRRRCDKPPTRPPPGRSLRAGEGRAGSFAAEAGCAAAARIEHEAERAAGVAVVSGDALAGPSWRKGG